MTALLGGFLGYFIEPLSEKVITYKQKQKNKEYSRYSYNFYLGKIIDVLSGAFLFGISFYYFSLFKAILASIFALLALLGVKVDQKIRIIPNELVLIILLLGLIYQGFSRGFTGIKDGILALVVTSIIFFLAGFITKKLSGSIGVGAGDVKLAMAISAYSGISGLYDFYLGIAIFLALYILVGFKTKKLKMGSTFPMATQIMGGFMVVIFAESILDLISKVY